MAHLANQIFQLYKKSLSGLSWEMWLLSFATLINRAGMMVLPFLSVYLTTQLGFTLKDAGKVMFFFGFGSMIGALLGGKLSDRFGHFRVQFFSLLLAGFAFMSLAYLDNSFFQWCVMIAITACIADAFRPAMFAAINDFSTEETRTRSVSLLRLMINLGISFGPAIGGFCAVHYGYEWLFFIEGITCILAAVFMLVFLRHTHKVPEVMSLEDRKANKIQSPWTDGYFLFFMFMHILNILVFAQFFNAYPVYLKEVLGFEEDVIGMVLALNGLVIFFFEMPLVYIGERKWNSDYMISIGALMIGLSFLLLCIAKWATVPIVLIGILLITFGELYNFPFVNSKVLACTNDVNRGSYMGIYSMVWAVAMMLSPLGGMAIAEDYGYEVLWVVCMVFSGIATMGFLFHDRIFGIDSPSGPQTDSPPSPRC